MKKCPADIPRNTEIEALPGHEMPASHYDRHTVCRMGGQNINPLSENVERHPIQMGKCLGGDAQLQDHVTSADTCHFLSVPVPSPADSSLKYRFAVLATDSTVAADGRDMNSDQGQGLAQAETHLTPNGRVAGAVLVFSREALEHNGTS